MDAAQYQAICQHFETASILDEEPRRAYLDDLQKVNPELARDVRRLILNDGRAAAAGFLEFDEAVTPTIVSPPGTDFAEDPDMKGASASIGNYKLGEKIGEGGMGVIYRAFQPDADRDVALKIIRSGQFTDADQLRRFRNEAKAAAAMQHQHIVPVYEVGEQDGLPFFTMAIVEGQNLQEQLQRQPMDPREAAQLVKVLAGAIDYAHGRGIIHRDLKPGNVLIDSQAKPWLTDFGIAKRLNADEGQTRTGQIVGTASYISPEQIDRQDQVGPRTDVYGLGAILYQCLTGVPPFSGDDLVEILTDVKTRLPTVPRQINHDIDGDLESICMRCLQKEPADRYSSAKALVQDLDRYLKGEPLHDTGSSWARSLARVLNYQKLSGEVPSAGAARWTLITSVSLHLAVYLLLLTEQSHYWLWSGLAAGTVCQGFISYRFHWSQYWQLQPVERQSGIIQSAVSLAFICLFLIHGPLTLDEPTRNILAIYPPLSIVFGVATIAHAGIHSGKWLISGFLCFPISLLSAWYPDLGPLLMSSMAALILGRAYYELRKAVNKPARSR